MQRLSEIGVAIIGTGFMARVHIEALRRVGVAVRGILGSSGEKSRGAAAEFNLPRAYDTLDQLLGDSTVHSVHVNTPNRWHLPQAAAAIRAGKHVLCEKPLAMDRKESVELVRLANKNPQLVTGVNYNNRFYPLCHEAREFVRRGEAGRIFHVTGNLVQDWLLYDTDYNWRVLASEGGTLRALSDIGSHWLDLVTFITGLEIESVLADSYTVHPIRHRPRGEIETFTNKLKSEVATEPVAITTDDYSSVLIRFVGGARGNLWVSQVSPGRKCAIRFEIAGQIQTLAWNSEQCEELWVGRRDGPNCIMLNDPPLLHDAARAVSAYPAGHAQGYPDSFKQCFRAFYKYIAAGDYTAPRSFATFAEGHRDIVLCGAFIESAASGRWVRPDL